MKTAAQRIQNVFGVIAFGAKNNSPRNFALDVTN
jgi:hypothetical protein